MNAGQLRRDIVRPALLSIAMHSDAAEQIIMGTAAQESNLEYVRQLNDGPALGLFQMEPATHNDIWSNYLAHRPQLVSTIRRAIQFKGGTPSPTRMIWDNRYAAIMCRIHYRRVPEPLPSPSDIWGMAYYYKEYYNTRLGAATVEEFVANFRKVV